MNLFELERKYSFIGSPIPKSTKGLSQDEISFYESQKEIRKMIKLPMKQLVYYISPYSEHPDPVEVISYDAEKFKNAKGVECDWYSVRLQILGIDRTICIHGDYFSEMQKPNFIETSISEEKSNE